MKLRLFLVFVLGVLAGMVPALAAVSSASPPPVAHISRSALCPSGYACPGDPVDFIDQSQSIDPQFIVSDPSNAPQFSVGTGGAASWANPLCITNNPLTNPPLGFVACIGGPWGNGQGRPLVTLYGRHGHAYTLTTGDIAWIHQQRYAQKVR